MTIELQFLGAATTVTGSQFLLTTDRATILIDCGMFQGGPNESVRNRIPLAFDPKELDAILLTHAHLDHCGLIPHVVQAGFGGPIWATKGTVELARSCSSTPGKLQEEFAKRDARWEKRHPDKAAAEDLQDAGGARGGRRARRGRRAAAVIVSDPPFVVPPPGSAATGEHVETVIEPMPPPRRRPGARAEGPAAPPRHRPRRAAVHRGGRPRAARLVPGHRLRRGDRGRAGDPRHVRRCRPHPRLGDHPARS